MVAACDFRDGKLAAISLHPVDIGYGKNRAQRGRPLLARDRVASETLQRVKFLSERYGTVINIANNVATVALS